MYDMPAEIDVRAEGALRIITLNRPDSLNSVNDDLHSGLAKIWRRLTDDPTARAAVITGAGRAFSPAVTSHISRNWRATLICEPRPSETDAR